MQDEIRFVLANLHSVDAQHIYLVDFNLFQQPRPDHEFVLTVNLGFFLAVEPDPVDRFGFIPVLQAGGIRIRFALFRQVLPVLFRRPIFLFSCHRSILKVQFV